MSRFPTAAVSAADRQTRDRRFDEARELLRRATAEVQESRLRVEMARQALKAAGRPEGLGRTLIGLVYLSVVCLVAPLALMAWGRVTLPALARAGVVTAFCSGLVVFFLELLRLARAAQRD